MYCGNAEYSCIHGIQRMEDYMKLKKFTAMSLTVAMAAATLAGCGSAEKESSETKEVSAKSFADAVEKGSAIQKGNYSVTMNLSLKGDDLELFGSDEEEIMKTLGMKADTLDAKLTLSGKIAGTDAMSMKVGVECGKIKGDLTEFILADDTLYVNVSNAVDMVVNVADLFDLKDEVETYTTLIPDGDYIAIPVSTIKDVYEAVLENADVSDEMDEIKDTLNDEDTIKKLQKSAAYLLSEAEKIAKEADGVYSSKDGYTIEINNDNAVSLVKAFIKVFAEDGEDIMKSIQDIVGDMGVSADDAISEITSDPEKLQKDLEDAMNEDDMPDFSLKIGTDYSGEEGAAVWTLSYGIDLKMDNDNMSANVECKVSEDQDVKVKAPDSVMDEEDIKSILALAGIDLSDLSDLIRSYGSGVYDDFDYDYDDDYDYEDLWSDDAA